MKAAPSVKDPISLKKWGMLRIPRALFEASCFPGKNDSTLDFLQPGVVTL